VDSLPPTRTTARVVQVTRDSARATSGAIWGGDDPGTVGVDRPLGQDGYPLGLADRGVGILDHVAIFVGQLAQQFCLPDVIYLVKAETIRGFQDEEKDDGND
jgi:hypothetical protein